MIAGVIVNQAQPEVRFGWGIFCVILATIGWSLSGFFVRGVPELDAWTINAYRAGSCSIFLIGYLVLKYRGDLTRHLWPARPEGLLIVACFFAGGSTLYMLALTLASVAGVACLGAISPVFAALLAWVFMREKTSLISLLAALVTLVGVYLIMSAESEALATGFTGTLVALGVAFCFAGQAVALRQFRHFDMVPGIALGGLVVVVVVVALTETPLLSWREIGLLAVMGVVQLAVPLILFAEGAKHVPAVPLVLIALADVVLNPFWAWLGYREVPPEGTYIGGAMILTAIATAVIFEDRRRRFRTL